MTSGITDPQDYYYRRVYTDAVRAARTPPAPCPRSDPDKIIVAGGSQGGGITIAAAALAALSGIPLVGSAPDVPFLCHFRRAVELTDRLPYGEITQYLAAWRDHAEQAYATLAYFDGAVLGRLASAPTLFSVALMDAVCPASTVFAAYHAYGADAAEPVSDKEIRVYGHNGHEGGGPYQIDAQLDWFAARFAAGAVDLRYPAPPPSPLPDRRRPSPSARRPDSRRPTRPGRGSCSSNRRRPRPDPR